MRAFRLTMRRAVLSVRNGAENTSRGHSCTGDTETALVLLHAFRAVELAVVAMVREVVHVPGVNVVVGSRGRGGVEVARGGGGGELMWNFSVRLEESWTKFTVGAVGAAAGPGYLRC